jgi:hypothetical protein
VTTPRRSSLAVSIQENAQEVAGRFSVRWIAATAAATVAWLALDNLALLPVVALTALGAANSTYAWYRLAKYRAKPSTHIP